LGKFTVDAFSGERRRARGVKEALALMLILLLLFIGSVVPLVDASSFFDRTYERMGIGKAYTVVQTSDGGYVLVGITEGFEEGNRDFWLVKTDSDGNMEWNKTYGGTKDDFAYSVVQTSDGGYAMEGYTNSFGAGGYDFWLVKTDSLGNMEWNQTYGGPSDDHAFSMVQTADGGYVLVGETESFGAKFTDFLLVKTDSFGKMEWNKTYDAIAGRDYAPYVIQSGDGGYALVGRTQSSVVEGYDCWLIKTDSFGNIEWNKTFRVVGDPHPNSIVQTGDGGYAIAGGPDYWLVKTDSSGNTEWNKTFTLSPKGDWCHCMIQTKDGSYLLVGTKSYNLMALTKTDASGNLLWNQTYGYGAINSVIQTSDGGYALAGYNFHQGINFCLIKTDEVGVIPEFPSWTLISVLLCAIIAVSTIYRVNLEKQN